MTAGLLSPLHILLLAAVLLVLLGGRRMAMLVRQPWAMRTLARVLPPPLRFLVRLLAR